jgi:hypothetical protein
MKFILIATFMAVGGQEPDRLAKVMPSLVECSKEAKTWTEIAQSKGYVITSISCSELLEPKK